MEICLYRVLIDFDITDFLRYKAIIRKNYCKIDMCPEVSKFSQLLVYCNRNLLLYKLLFFWCNHFSHFYFTCTLETLFPILTI